MKKSKVIIPAMAMILFSTAASISGTVAWFTANRVFTSTTGEFTIANLDGNLEAVVAAGVGTVVDSTDVKKINAQANSYLIDGSFNHDKDSLHAFKYGTDVDTNYEDRGLAAGSNWLYTTRTISSTTNSYYVAYSWTITFSYTFTATETSTIGVFLNLDSGKSNFIPTGTGTAGKPNAAKGFRIAFTNTATPTLNKVWGALASVDSNDCAGGGVNSQKESAYKYVSAANAVASSYAPIDTVSAQFLSKASMTSAGSYTHLQDEYDSNKTAKERICTITKGELDGEDNSELDAANKGKTTVTCVAWYEGEDPNVVNDSILLPCSANMSFYSRLDGTKTS